MSKSPKKNASIIDASPVSEGPVTFYNHTMDLTESIRDKIEELRRAKHDRFELLKGQLETELHEKNHLLRNVYHEFEQAVAIYQKVAEQESLSVNVECKTAEKTEPSMEVIKSPPQPEWIAETEEYESEYSEQLCEQIEEKGPYRSSSTPAYNELPPPTLYEPLPSTYKSLSSSPSKSVPTAITVATGEKAIVKPTKTILEEHKAQCEALKRRSDKLSTSINRIHQKLLLAREDYHRSLRAFDELEAELCATSADFEEHQKHALETFWETLNRTGGESLEIYEEYGRVQEEGSKKRKREASPSKIPNGRIEELEKEVKKAKRTTNVVLGMSLLAASGWIGKWVIAGVASVASKSGLWESFLG